MDIDIDCKDVYGGASYAKLFEDILSDIGKATAVDKAKILLNPDGPLFVFSVRLKAIPTSKTIEDVANIRSEGSGVHLSITDERYAPAILDQLWKKYGRGAVEQQTRFDLDICNAKDADVSALVVASGEEYLREIVGALWRIMPEGIKNRRSFITGNILTVVATEEMFQQDMVDIARSIHVEMGGE